MLGLAPFHGQIALDHAPDLVRKGDRVAVEIKAERSDEIGLGAIADGGGDGLACQHMRAVKLPADDPVKQHLPVGLRFQRDVQSFFGEKALFLGDGQRGHVRQLDETQLQTGLFNFSVEICSGHCFAAAAVLAARTAAGQRDTDQYRRDQSAPVKLKTPGRRHHAGSRPLERTTQKSRLDSTP